MADKLTVDISDELQSAAAIAAIDPAATIANVQQQILAKGVEMRTRRLVEAYVQLPWDAQDRILASVLEEVQTAIKAGGLQPGRMSVAQQLLSRGPGSR